ncbi:MAG: RloB family protein [Suipraeoptans sp.]
MAREYRKNQRTPGRRNTKPRVMKLGNYLIFTDTKNTERYFFEGLKSSLPKEVQDNIAIKVQATTTKKLIEDCQKTMVYDSQYRSTWIVLDRDRVTEFDKIVEEAERKNINVGWSNPCFEIWMHAYFGEMPKTNESTQCCSNFSSKFKKICKAEYSKSDKLIYKKLKEHGDEEKAISISEKRFRECEINGTNKPSMKLGCTTVYELVKNIREAVKRKV